MTQKMGEAMKVENEVYPNADTVARMLQGGGPSGPMFMVNLLKFKDRAEYQDGRESSLTGREAYMIYARAVDEILLKFGGRGVFVGDVSGLVLGQVEELWDQVAIAMYPNRAAMMKMSMSPEFQEIAPHRTAGLKGQLNIETNLLSDLLGPARTAALVGS